MPTPTPRLFRSQPDTASGWPRNGLVALPSLIFSGWLLVNDATGWTRMVVSDVAFIVAPTIAGWRCAEAARRDTEWRRGWWWLAAACATWLAGSLIWAVYEIGFRVISPFPSLADLGYLGYVVPAVLGVGNLFRNGRRRLPRLRADLDSVAIIGSLLFVGWTVLIEPAARAHPGALFVKLDAAGYPLVDVVVTGLVLVLGARYAYRRRRVWALLSLGLCTLAVSDSLYVARALARDYRPGTWLDLGWVVAFGLVAAAADSAGRPGRAGAVDEPVRSGVLLDLLPYGPIALALWSAAIVRPTPTHRPIAFSLGAALLVVLVVRQFVVVADHAELTRGLTRAVALRTDELKDRERWWQSLVHHLSDVVLVLAGDGSLVWVSPSLEGALGKPSATFDREAFEAGVHPADRPQLEAAIHSARTGGTDLAATCRIAHRDGRWRWFQVTMTALPDGSSDRADDPVGHGPGTVVVLHDISELHQLTERLTYQAGHDPLTDLPNRRLMHDGLAALLERAGHEDDCVVSVLTLDLDGFKAVNDRFGHAAGDDVLVAVAARLRGALREDDLVARLSGDEFALALGPSRAAAAEIRAVRVAERILAAVCQPFDLPRLPGEHVMIAASVGLARSGRGPADPDELLRNADLAMYEAKSQGKNCFRTFDPSMRTRTLARLELHDRLRQALDRREFVVHYQPVVDLANDRVCGTEALLRWRHPQRGDVSPTEFVPAVESMGLIRPLGAWVLRTACTQLRSWQDDYPRAGPLSMAVNVSPLQLEPGFVGVVTDILAECGLAPSQLILEITEGVLTADVPNAQSCLSQLDALGARLSVDDFGTGYSSLARLQSFPIRELKIDQSFVAGIGVSDASASLVASIINLAHALDLEVVAEGVESPAQHVFLRDHGCQRAQGYLLGRPLPAEQIGWLLAGPTRWESDRPAPPGRPAVGELVPLPQREFAALLAGSAPSERQLNRVVHRLLGKLAEVTGFESTYLARIDWAGELQEIVYARNAGVLQIPEGAQIDWSVTLCRYLFNGGPRASAEVASDYPAAAAAVNLGLQSYVGVPIYRPDGGVYGTLCAVSQDSLPCDERVVRVMELFAELLTNQVSRLPAGLGRTDPQPPVRLSTRRRHRPATG